MIEGSTPADAYDLIVQSGLIPNSSALSFDITTTAAPASLIPEALPAVTNPLGLIVLSLASVSGVVPGLGPSSLANETISFFFLTSTGTISASNAPDS